MNAFELLSAHIGRLPLDPLVALGLGAALGVCLPLLALSLRLRGGSSEKGGPHEAGELLHLLYLHGMGDEGWGWTSEECYVYQEVRRLVDLMNDKSTGSPRVVLHALDYHPGGDIAQTKIEPFLDTVVEEAERLGGFAAVIGCSFGGMLSSVLQERRPDLFSRLVLLAPAIDNFERNYKHNAAAGPLPVAALEELEKLPPRPRLLVPTKIIHGALDNDEGGSEPRRIDEWVASSLEEDRDGRELLARERGGEVEVWHPAGVDHSMEPWLYQENASDAPALQGLLEWAVAEQIGTNESTLPPTSDSPDQQPAIVFIQL
mmetsp:Transcript_52259/g.138017  ORF Transcript_52259/g.138017 Transcript_52259/m.138017 type:complete len:317 (+) Transcript_52259:107-1057(+)